MNRREFLQVCPSVPYTPSAVPEIALLHFARQAMATRFEIVLPFGTPEALAAAEDALDLIDHLEDQLTVYRDHSEVSRINWDAAEAPVSLEDRLFELLRQAEQITQETEGAFDVTTGALTKAWGFYRRQGRVPTAAERDAVMERVGMRHVDLDEDRRTVRLQRRGLEINLGSIGKGYALDRAAERLRQEWGIGSALLHGGFSSVCAVGHPPGDPRGWSVGVRHPWRSKHRLAVVRLRDRALGTSAATFQNLEYNGRKLGHILDPRTGWPAEGMASATVVAPTAAEADALATAFFILGADKARAYCESHPEIGAVLLTHEQGAAPVVLGLASEAPGSTFHVSV